MNWFLIIVGIVLTLIALVCLVVSIFPRFKCQTSDEFGLFFIVGIVGIILILHGGEDSPKAIDVYRDKTELKITYTIQGCDTLQRDSVVVWRK